MITRRGFLAGMLAACAAPAIVKAGSLMRIDPRIITIPEGYFQALQASIAQDIGGNRILTMEEIVKRSLEILNKELENDFSAELYPTAFSSVLIDTPMQINRAKRTSLELNKYIAPIGRF